MKMKNMRSLRFFLVVFLLTVFLPMQARGYSFFEHYSTQNGLSCNFVTSIAQDAHGFIWVGTEYGLNRFDGINFISYTKDNTPSLMRNDIRCMELFSDSSLVIGGYRGMLHTYAADMDTFTDSRFPELMDVSLKSVVGFQKLADNSRYVLTTSGVYRCETGTDKFAESTPLSASTNPFFVESLFMDKNGNYWVGAFDGLHIFSSEGVELHFFSLSVNEKISASSILPLDDNRVLVASNVGGLWLIEMDNEGNYLAPRELKTEFKNVSAMMKDRNENIWLGTWGYGLWRMDAQLQFQKVMPYSGGEGLQKIHALFEDRSGNIWVGTQNSGLWRYRTDRENIVHHSADFGFPNVDASCFIEDNAGALYVGSDGHGIFKLSDQFVCQSHWQEDSGLLSNNILSFAKEKNGDLLFSSWSGGLERINVQNNKISPIQYEGLKNPIDRSKCVRVMQDGEIWVAVQGEGIYRRLLSGKWTKMRFAYMKDYADEWMDYIEESKSGVKWIISSNGVWRYENEKMKFLSLGMDSSDPDPYSFYDGACDAEGNFYVASNRGIARCMADGSKIEVLDSLPKAKIASIFIDEEGKVWCSGSCGILEIDPKSKTYRSIPFASKEHGQTYFMSRAIYKGKDGKLFFGCSDGFIFFNPKTACQDSVIDYLSWANIWINGEKQHITSDNVVLKHGTQMNVTFDLLNLSGADDVLCFYRVAELDNQWHALESNRSIQFNYIPAGKYTLQLKAYRYGHEDKASSLSMVVDVLPPWWATLWFRLLVGLFLVIVVITIIHMRFVVLQRRQRILQEMVDARTSDLLNAMKDKDRLVSIIAHDLKNPMFSIVCGLEMLTGRLDKSMEKKDSTILSTVTNSARNLQKELLQLLDWATSRQTDVKFTPAHIDLHQLTNDVLSLLKGLLNDKLIFVHLNCDLEKCAHADGRMIGTVIRNVVNNAIKFTPRRGHIYITISEKSGKAIVEVRDTGVGMDEEHLNVLRSGGSTTTKGTDNEQGTGLGFRICTEFAEKNGGTIQLESKLGEGTTVTLTLPLSETEVCKEKTFSKAEEMEENQSEMPVEVDSNHDLLDGNTVLVVDDDPLLRLNIRQLLEPYMTVVEAEDGEAGFAMACQQIPDLIITDVEMPRMNGMKMSAALHEQKSTTHIPLIFLSARNSEEDRMEGFSSGAIDYISKPFSANELLAKVINILHWRRKQQQRVLMGGNYQKEDGEEVPVINPLLKNVLDVIEANYTESEFSVEDLARELTMSKSTLIRRLKSITDKTPIEILSEYRLNKADALLRKQDLPVKEVAFLVGFNDQYYFSRKYKEHFGYPPSKA